MKKWIFTLFTLSFALFATAQETKIEDPNAEKRTIKPFHSVRVGDGIDLYLSQSTEESVVASASREEYRNRLKTEVEDGLLKIYYDRESFSDWTSSGKKLKVYVSFKTLQKLTATAGSHVKVDGAIREKSLNLFLRSGAQFKGTVEVEKLLVETESGASSSIAGSAGEFHISANSGARMKAYDLAVSKADIRSTSGAKVEVTVKDEMKLYSSSGGSIYYKGNARISEVGTNIGAVIRKADS
jgi:hypothetical protein